MAKEIIDTDEVVVERKKYDSDTDLLIQSERVREKEDDTKSDGPGKPAPKSRKRVIIQQGEADGTDPEHTPIYPQGTPAEGIPGGSGGINPEHPDGEDGGSKNEELEEEVEPPASIVTNTVVICGFPGVGKTTLFKESQDKNAPLTILDSDSRFYRWIYKDGAKTDQHNPEFPDNYIAHIKENIGKVDVILVATHKQVRDALRKEGIYYCTVFPTMWDKDLYRQRYHDRGDSDAFVSNIMDNWLDYLSEMKWINDNDDEHFMYYELDHGEYLSDRISDIIAEVHWFTKQLGLME